MDSETNKTPSQDLSELIELTRRLEQAAEVLVNARTVDAARDRVAERLREAGSRRDSHVA